MNLNKVSNFEKLVQSESYIGTPNLLEVTLKGERLGIGKHYVTISRVDLFDGEAQVERSFGWFSTAKMEVGQPYVLQIIY